jgi:hypothetical protein
MLFYNIQRENPAGLLAPRSIAVTGPEVKFQLSRGMKSWFGKTYGNEPSRGASIEMDIKGGIL